ncbi:MAG: PucR family transcriptional regulator ligand-binding domain-containing protein [Clostridiales Family XIII bacterium]|nr:PucR family transcriptional regulator ligand-binding domain-containing protein [Clostridiales Family XIII bacterium]
MSVTVRNILSLPSFQGASILAGEDFLDNRILQVSIADSPVSELDYEISRGGDFYLSVFYFEKDSIESTYQFLDALIDTKASGLCIFDEYVQNLPDEIIAYCNDHRFPVLLVSVTIPYASIIREIMELIILDGQNTLLANKITSLISGALDDKHKLLTLQEINPHFQNYISAVYVLFTGDADSSAGAPIVGFINRRVDSFALMYERGLLGLITYNAPSGRHVEEKIDHYIAAITSLCPQTVIGVSGNGAPLQGAATPINQALFAAKIGINNNAGSSVVAYDKLGITKLLLRLSGHKEMEDFCHEILDPLLAHDEKNGSQLFDTMRVFLEQKKDYRVTAKTLFVHENTVRYRIEKAKEIIEDHNAADDFCESFSLALKCRQIV